MSHMFVKTKQGQIAVRAIDESVRDVFARFANKNTIELSFQRNDIETAGWTHEDVTIVADTGLIFIAEGRSAEIYMISKSVLQNY